MLEEITKNVSVNWGSTPISVVPMRGQQGVTGVIGIGYTGAWGTTGLWGITGRMGTTGLWGVTGIAQQFDGLAINTDNSSPAVVVGGTTFFVSAPGSTGGTNGKDARSVVWRMGDGGAGNIGSGTGGNGGSFAIDIGSGGTGSAAGNAGNFHVSVNGVSLLSITGQAVELFCGENAQNVFVGGSNSGGGSNASINIGQAGCDAIYFGNAGGNCFLNMLGHIQVDSDYNSGVTIFENTAILGSASQNGAIAVYRGGNLIGYIPIFSVA